MPATAGRVRMPANNRVHSSAALQTHGIWQSAIGYDPYAPEKDSKGNASERAAGEGGPENAYASFQGLLALARITGSSANDTRGACKKCGRVGHLTYQCRNFLSVKEDKEKDEAALQNAAAAFDKIKKVNGFGKENEEESSSEEEESESSDSDVDPEIERIIAARMGKTKKNSEGRTAVEKHDRRKEKKRRNLDERKEKRRRRKHESSSEEDRRRRRRNDSRRRRRDRESSDDDSEDDDRRRRKHRSHRHRSSGKDSDRSKSKHSKRRNCSSDSEDYDRRPSKRAER